MFNVISAAVGSLYSLEVLLFASLTYLALDWALVQRLFGTTDRKTALIADVSLSMVKEVSLQLLLGKWLFIKVVSLLGGFRYTLCWILSLLDYATLAGLCIVYYNMLQEKSSAEQAVRAIDSQAESISSFLDVANLKKCINPIWVSDGVILHPNITYSTNEEKNEALEQSNNDFDQPRKMMLDVYTTTTTKNSNALRPVLVHIHGGGWQSGTKNAFLPFEKMLLSDNNWIVVNIDYRLSPVNKYPAHLVDVKRAIRWVKQNISRYGGDPQFIILSGDSAGGHLAAMASLTENDPKYQVGFESVDTSVRGVVSISGVLDIGSVKRYAKAFSLDIAQLPSIDYNYLFENSPVSCVPQAKEQNKLVPYLLVHGEQDALVTCEMSKRFKEVYDKENGPQCDLHLVKGGSHVHYMLWSPRSYYSAHVIQAWCNQLYIKNK
ncbi:alpha/beta-hydrolase [Backusella circina FSU 941]|nr:alpha/beta-hydrolase [Backusella circina FSU 941]